MSKKFISLLLSLLLVLGTVAVPAGAAKGDPVTLCLYNSVTDKQIGGTISAKEGDPYTFYMNSVSDPTMTGYDFKGWSSDKAGKNKIDMTASIPSGDVVFLYAIWEAKDVTVIFHDGYGGTIETKTLKYNSNYSLPSDPTRTGYTFVGWFTSSSGGTQVTANDTVSKDYEHTLYAHWTTNVYTVSFYDNPNGTTSTQPDRTLDVAYGRSIGSLTKPTRTGYTCTWKKGSATGADALDSETITGALSLYAVWTPKKVTVTLNANGGGFPSGTAPSAKIAYGDPYSSLATTANQPTRDGYTFKGWALTANGSVIANNAVVNSENNHFLYAIWGANPYNITYDYNFPAPAVWKDAQGNVIAGSAPTPPPGSPVTYNSSYPALPTPASLDIPYYSEDSAKQYTFEGWYAAKDDVINTTDPKQSTTYKKIIGGTNGDTYSLTSDQTLHARWGYEIEFFANTGAAGGTAIGKLECITGKAYDVNKMPKDPTRVGYKFAGWYNDPVSGDKVELNAFKLADGSNKALYAHWDPASYKVTLDPNGGALPAGTDDKIDVTYQATYIALSGITPTRKGYTFAGWYTATGGDTKVDAVTTVERAENHTLYAHWTPRPANLSIDYLLPADFEDTDNKYPELKNKKINIGEKLSTAGLPAKPASFEYGDPKVKFDFYDWYTTADDGTPGKKGSQVNGQTSLTAEMVDDSLNITLYARWTMPVSFCNNYNGNATETTRPDSTDNFVIGSVYGDKLPAPTRTGYTFLGWFTEPGEGDGAQKTATDIATNDVTRLYAHWTTSAYVITLDPNGGAFSESQNIRSSQFNYNDQYGDFLTKYIPTAPAGHTFNGWYTEKEGGRKLNETDRVTSGGTIYAQWKADQFKVTLKLNYSGASDTVKTVDYGTELKDVLPTPEPERAGYAFLGWYTDEGFTTPANPAEKIAADVTLYAQWREGKRVDLVVGGGKLPENTPTYIYVYDGGTFNRLPTPTWAGCIFGGWWTAETGGEQVTVTTPANSNPPATLYARWTPRQVLVRFDYNGAPNLQREPKSFDIGSPYTGLPTYASWPGHEFMGWYTRSAGGEKIDSNTLVSVPSDTVEELTIYAHWGYKVSFDPVEGTGEMDQQVAEMNQPYTLPTCTFTPPDGMRFGGWAIGEPDGPKQAGGSQYTVTRNLVLYATWTTAPIVITSSCTSGGSLMTEDGKANAVTVERGQDVTFVAAANTGYVLKELMVDGVNFNYTDVYTFRNVIEDHTIHAVFAPEGAPGYATCEHGSSCPLSRFRDLEPGAWYHDGVHFCIDNVIMGGTGNNVFDPNSQATRAEVATTLWNYAGRPPISGSGALPRTYRDVLPSAWYYQAVEWATQQGILSGYGDGTFRPNNRITREELVSILWHHAGQPRARQTLLRFYDAWQVSDWAWNAMLWATEAGVLSGRSVGYLVPKGNATRAEVATMLKNYLG